MPIPAATAPKVSRFLRLATPVAPTARRVTPELLGLLGLLGLSRLLRLFRLFAVLFVLFVAAIVGPPFSSSVRVWCERRQTRITVG
ncbi:hypothetical protein ACLGI4_12890 [Streptomyces sp. HMX112]|uniref:hypothetical protein n=1 Tax=Streptomyces sp. HMX112 TaxID=3390850 RepID=UPI003A80B7FC